jgi:ABC-type dipeptide/oligopeptide/nickel transport system permease component
MRAILLHRAVQLLVVALLVGGLSFAMMQMLPGDPAMRIAAGRYGPDALTGASADLVRIELGLDRPAPVRFAEWMGQLLRLDLGYSLVSGGAVIDELRTQLGFSVQLALLALVASLILGLLPGVLAGLRPGGVTDRATLIAAVGLRATPLFAIGLVLILGFAVWLPLLPPGGSGGVRELLLPTLTLALALAAVTSRVTRDTVREVASRPHVAFARHRGLAERDVVVRHMLRNAAIPVIAFLAVQTVYLIEGVIIVESLFALPGIGHALVHALFARDVPVVQGAALLMGVLFVAINTAVDLLALLIDPRLRLGR